MPHPGIDVIRQLLGDTRHQPATIHERRAGLELLTGEQPLPAGVTGEEVTVAGRPALRITPDGGGIPGAVLLYLHGGGYCAGSPRTHRTLAGNLALGTGAPTVVLDYRLGPEDPFPGAVDDAAAAIEELGTDGTRVAVAGDSAGGGLTFASALAQVQRGGVRPVALAGISPWTDLTGSGDSNRTREEVDPMLTRDVLLEYAAAYLDGADPTDPLASPLLAPPALLAELPPTRIDVGDDEVLLDDSTVLAERLAEAGIDVAVRVWPEMVHVFPAFPPELVPEAAEAVAAISTFLAGHLAG